VERGTERLVALEVGYAPAVEPRADFCVLGDEVDGREAFYFGIEIIRREREKKKPFALSLQMVGRRARCCRLDEYEPEVADSEAGGPSAASRKIVDTVDRLLENLLIALDRPVEVFDDEVDVMYA